MTAPSARPAGVGADWTAVPYWAVLLGAASGTAAWAIGSHLAGWSIYLLAVMAWTGREVAVRIYRRDLRGQLAPDPALPGWRRFVAHTGDAMFLSGALIFLALAAAGVATIPAAVGAVIANLVVAAWLTAADERHRSRLD